MPSPLRCTIVAQELTIMLARDGEGATKVIEVRVQGAETIEDARRVAMAVVQSPLVKTAVYGADPNWGRIACAAGYSGAALDQERLDVAMAGTTLMRQGTPLPFDRNSVVAAIKATTQVPIDVDLHLGAYQATAWGLRPHRGLRRHQRPVHDVGGDTMKTTDIPDLASPNGDPVTNTLVEALPFVTRWSGCTLVIKLGGSALEAERAVLEDCVHLQRLGAIPVIVHGGGASINAWLKRIGKESRFEHGLRVTDAETRDVARMTLIGEVNATLVALVNRLGGRAVGLSGLDGPMIPRALSPPVRRYRLRR